MSKRRDTVGREYGYKENERDRDTVPQPSVEIHAFGSDRNNIARERIKRNPSLRGLLS